MARVKTCFVIMPFGKKPDSVSGGASIDFDAVYERFIKKTIEDVGLKCLRCDEIDKPGLIHTDMLNHIFDDDVAVVDITTLNANVFYELGVRHALNKSVTVLIRRKGTSLPFNIAGLRVIDYDYEHLDTDEDSRQLLRSFVQAGLKNSNPDSPVHTSLDRLRVAGNEKRLPDGSTFNYKVPGAPNVTITLMSGDLRRIKGIDVWVNSENTNMQMARFYERSVSSIIRYLGAKKDRLGIVTEDSIANELAEAMGGHQTVPPSTVIATGSGELARTHGVKSIFHAAAVTGEIGHGYGPVENIGDCVSNALELASTTNTNDIQLRSILFQMMGGGTAGGDVETIAQKLLGSAVDYLRSNPNCPVTRVYFHVTREETLELCQRVLNEAGTTPVKYDT